jgi:alkylhydroperoxidase family enzyme
LSEAQIKDLDHYEQSSAYTEQEKLVLKFAEQWTRQNKVSAEVVQTLLKGLSQSQMVVLAATAALANWTNKFNESFGVELP